MIILGIESSCDETAASIAKCENGQVKILSNVVSSQIEIHKQWGGVVPEVAAREHVLNILPVIDEALNEAGISRPAKTHPAQTLSDLPLPRGEFIDAIAVTQGPGLITSLLTGMETAKSLAFGWGIPLIGVNHIEGHIYANFIGQQNKINFPAIALTVSGGHTSLILMKGHEKLKTIGETLDDAAGEAFDKAAKMMGIGYPGGPIISELAAEFKDNESNLKLPRPMIHKDNFDFSFSGLKTAIRYALEKDPNWKERIPEYCFEFQQAVIDVLIHKTIKATKKYNAKTVMLAGGVSANTELRSQLKIAVEEKLSDTIFTMPELKYTTDNAAMIAAAGCFKYQREEFSDWRDLNVDCNLEL